MQIDLINTLPEFNKLKDNWFEVYCADKEATVQRSWVWMKGWIESTNFDWFVLAAREENSSHYAGFIMLAYSQTGKGIKTLSLGGRPWAARTGILCIPDYKEQVIALFADYIQRALPWDALNLRDVCDGKITGFINKFSRLKYNIKKLEDTPCPQLNLTESWDKYTEKYLNKSKNKKLAYYLRRAEKELDYRVLRAGSGDLENDSVTLLDLWTRRFGQRSDDDLSQIKKLWETCYKEDSFWYELIFDGDAPVAGLAAFIDKTKGRISPFIIVHNEQYAKYSLGKVIVAHSLKYVIDSGFKVYDFGRGESEYKSWFGATDMSNESYIITKKKPGSIIWKPFKRLISIFKN